MESRCNMDKKPSNAEDLDMKALTDKIKPESKHGQAMSRSAKIRSNANFLPEDSVKMRKAYFTNKEKGYLTQKVKFNQMAMLTNPDMMGNMVKG